MKTPSHFRPIVILSLCIACCVFPDSAQADGSELSQSAREEPLFTGTLLSTRGYTVDQGHIMVMSYFYSTRFGGLYNNNWRLQSASVMRTNIQQTFLVYGLTNRIDVEIAPQWVGNHAEGQSFVAFGDFPVQVGFQAVRERFDTWVPNVRIWVQETFPTGHYTDLSPTSAAIAKTGGGSFATTVGIGAQKSFRWTDDHVFRARLNASYGFYSPVQVQGFNSYGGGFGTQGTVEPGSITTVIAAGEYTLTRHVVLALDISLQVANATHFSGTTGIGLNGQPATVGNGYNEIVTVAPAVEYNWNQHVGVIGGPWFSLTGRNTSEFFGGVAAVYLYW
ncbi:MAG TPA: hypothetical protein VJ746_14150 [Nitrospira sp.]|nr:hypothetical protein [Nitrospira sp.]